MKLYSFFNFLQPFKNITCQLYFNKARKKCHNYYQMASYTKIGDRVELVHRLYFADL